MEKSINPMLKKVGCEDLLFVQDIHSKAPVAQLRQMIGKRVQNADFSKHEIYLQEVLLNPNSSLHDYGFKTDGILEASVKVETFVNRKCLIIVDVSKPTLINTACIPGNTKEIDVTAPAMDKNDADMSKQEKEQSNVAIPGNPLSWSEDQVLKWMIWVGKGFGHDTSQVKNYHIDGKTLYKMTEKEFIDQFPYGQTLYQNFDLLKKLDEHNFVMTERVTPSKTSQSNDDESKTCPSENTDFEESELSPSAEAETLSVVDKNNCANKEGTNGQIQLWQFLIEVLTDADCLDYITWLGDTGEFKFLNPDMIAQMWGERKNRPTMNYQKLSRALRYYYDSEIISKVPGKRYVYKFVCDLKVLIGFTAGELNKLVSDCAERRRKVIQPQNVDEYLRNPDKKKTAYVLSNT